MQSVSVEVMQNSDKLTIRNGVSAITLLKRASDALYSNIPLNKSFNYLIVCGSGNNGGDGYSLAEILFREGYKVYVLACDKPKTEESLYYYNLISRIISEELEIIKKKRFDIIIDCIFGTGYKGELNGKYKKIIEDINATSAYIVSCDIPSGLNGNSGQGVFAIKANKTIALASAKNGYYLADGLDKCGEISVCDIGIEIIGERTQIVNTAMLRDQFLSRKKNCHKGDFGRVIIYACSPNFVGAGILATKSVQETLLAEVTNDLGESALRVGAGFATLCVPNEMLSAMWGSVINATLLAHEDFINLKADAIAFGMGVGKGDLTALEYAITVNTAPLVIDADGINMLSQNLKLLKNKSCHIILTPHVGEMSRLTGYSVAHILDNPICIAKEFAKEHKVFIVLKGCGSIITDGDRVFISTEGTPAQAKGGSGDILSGVIAGLLARKVEPIVACYTACYVCGKSAKETNMGDYALLATDVIKNIKGVIEALSN